MMQFDSTDIATLGWDLSVDRLWTINNAAADTVTLTAGAVPEPSTFVLLGMGAIGLIGYRRRKQKQLA